jgi:hypothetical protein
LDSIGRLRLFHLLHLSKPSRDRTVYRTIHAGRIRTILELGLGDCARALWMIRLAAVQNPGLRVGYTGLDRFEDCPSVSGAPVSLKTVYQRLRSTGAKVRLMPGDPLEALPRFANDLGRFDLVVISAQAMLAATPRAWFYLPRLLGPRSQVLVEEAQSPDQTDFRALSPAEIERLATPTLRRKAA